MLNLDRIVQEFPGTQDKAFLDAACVSIASRSACKAVADFANEVLMCPAESSTQFHIYMDRTRAEAVPQAAQLVGVREENIALVESTTHGLNIIGNYLHLPEGSEVLVSDMEFLQVAIPWAMQEGIQVKTVSSRGGRVLPEDFAISITPKTRLIVLSSTQWNNGFRCDLAAFSELCRQHEMFLVVDGIQQVGAIATWPERDGIDALIAGGHKWLNAPFGCGFMYVSQRLLERLEPNWWGYSNLLDPEGGWGTYFSTPSITSVRKRGDYHFIPTAKQLEIGGTSNYPGAAGLTASLRLVNDIGIGDIEQHVLNLTDILLEGLPRVGATVVTVPERRYRSGIVSFRFYKDVESERELAARLGKERVLVSVRFTGGVGGLRVSCHYFNTPDHLQALFDALGRAARDRAPDYSA